MAMKFKKHQEVSQEVFETEKKRGINPKLFLLVGIITVCLLFLAGGYFYFQYQRLLKNPELLIQQETTQLTTEISKFMVLPSETPQLATVVDPETLSDQNFFSTAEVGDKMLVYREAKLALLYRPSTKKIVAVSSITVQQP